MHPTRSTANINQPAPTHAPVLVDFRLFHPRSRPVTLIGWALLALAALLLLTTAADAQEATVGESPIGSRQFLGTAVRDGVIVWAGPSVADFRVATLSQGEEVVVVSGGPQFLRILPPEGTYCLVGKSLVSVQGEAAPGARRIGRITSPASVRVGSRINGSIDGTSARLSVGEEVTVLDEDSSYYKILPPKNVFFYVSKDDMAPVREVKVTETSRGWRVGELPAGPVAAQNQPAPNAEAGRGQQEAISPPTEAEETDGPAEIGGDADEADEEMAEVPVNPPAPAEQPVIVRKFIELDARYIESAKLPLEDQPLEALKQEYTALLAEATADPIVAPYVSTIEARIQTIEIRREALQDLQAMQAMRRQIEGRQQSLNAEQEELAERARDARITVYAAVGQLQPSSLQIGQGVLFRLCDPSTGRTLIYLRADAEQAKSMARLMEGFVGVKGEIRNDEDLKLRYITVAEITAVEQREVFRSVAAEIIPPSMIQNAGAGE